MERTNDKSSASRHRILLLPALCVLVILLVVVITLFYNEKFVIQHYLNSEIGVTLSAPHNWGIEYIERNGEIFLTAETGFFHIERTYIDIWPHACSETFQILMGNPNEDSIEVVNRDIDRIQLFYDDALEILEEPKKIIENDHEITKAVIAVPINSNEDYENEIRVDDPLMEYRTREIYLIKEANGDSFIVYFFPGKIDEINHQAREIILDIHRNCADMEYFKDHKPEE